MVDNPNINILLTESCLGKCPYCFNASTQDNKRRSPGAVMTLEGLEIILDFLIGSEIKNLRFMGGEPLLYPDIKKLINLVQRKGNWDNVTIFTSGLFPVDIFCLIDSLVPHLVVNINHPTIYTVDEWQIINRNLFEAIKRGLGITLGYNIYQVFFDYEFLLNIAIEYGIGSVRVCIANPIGTIGNDILRGKSRKIIGSRILAMVEAFSSKNIKIIFDCVLTPCLFSNDEYGRLVKLMHSNCMRDGVCSPALDIRPDLTVHRCFAMGDDLRAHISDFNNTRELGDYFIDNTDKFKWILNPEECKNCKEYINHKCQGDCLGFHLSKIKDIRVLEISSKPLFDLAYSYMSSGNPLMALNAFEDAFEIYHYNSEALCDYLYLLVKNGLIHKALETFDRYFYLLKTESIGKESFIKGLIAETRGDMNMAISNYRASLHALKQEKREYVNDRISHLLLLRN